MIPAAMHLHSTWSDGEFSLAELRERLQAEGFRAAFMADHADAFEPAAMPEYVAACAAHSDADFLFLAGTEFPCRDRMHIVGYGVTAPFASDVPDEVISHIRSHQGIAVIAHPRSDHFDQIEKLAVLPDGIEAWNTKYDGRAAPRPATFELIRRLRSRADVKAFFGLDLHWRHQYRGLLTHIDVDRLDAGEMLRALEGGAFHATCRELEFLPTAELDPSLAARFETEHARSHRLRRLLKGGKRFADRVGLRAPAALKAQLRRLF
jgi:predicted metal-dependent phosphoesterase TrpH